jgi:hypothetical protein
LRFLGRTFRSLAKSLDTILDHLGVYRYTGLEHGGDFDVHELLYLSVDVGRGGGVRRRVDVPRALRTKIHITQQGCCGAALGRSHSGVYLGPAELLNVVELVVGVLALVGAEGLQQAF